MPHVPLTQVVFVTEQLAGHTGLTPPLQVPPPLLLDDEPDEDELEELLPAPDELDDEPDDELDDELLDDELPDEELDDVLDEEVGVLPVALAPAEPLPPPQPASRVSSAMPICLDKPR